MGSQGEGSEIFMDEQTNSRVKGPFHGVTK